MVRYDKKMTTTNSKTSRSPMAKDRELEDLKRKAKGPEQHKTTERLKRRMNGVDDPTVILLRIDRNLKEVNKDFKLVKDLLEKQALEGS
jgi:hypothetical protein